MKVALYIPCRNGERFLPAVVEAVGRQASIPDAVLLVNDQSTDGTCHLAMEAGWNVASTHPERSGLSAARNVAYATAAERGWDVLAGLDADAVPTADYVAVLRKTFVDNPNLAGICGCMRERFTDKPADLWRAVNMPQHWGDSLVLNPPILFGSSAAYRTKVVLAAGGFNERLRTNFEDTDLTQRLLAANHQVAYIPTLRLEHLKQDSPDSVLRMFWNWYSPPGVLQKNFDSPNTWRSTRLQWIWADFRARCSAHRDHPTLALITLALPWTQLARDLNLLAASSSTDVDLRSLSACLRAVLQESGFDDSICGWIEMRYGNCVSELHRDHGPPLHADIIRIIADEARKSIPRRDFWSDVHASAVALQLTAATQPL